ncbi:hypothetical protein PIB30_066577 [Stylosanthes scabra]|uniref:Uncharacterized protein n=1 Tax=Stylosanthes scabra TaxID=79078 RepID=A0ABU6UPT4_9FABA|nr:hypothetical protein [Stylosanthes scabra]
MGTVTPPRIQSLMRRPSAETTVGARTSPRHRLPPSSSNLGEVTTMLTQFSCIEKEPQTIHEILTAMREFVEWLILKLLTLQKSIRFFTSFYSRNVKGTQTRHLFQLPFLINEHGCKLQPQLVLGHCMVKRNDKRQ